MFRKLDIKILVFALILLVLFSFGSIYTKGEDPGGEIIEQNVTYTISSKTSCIGNSCTHAYYANPMYYPVNDTYKPINKTVETGNFDGYSHRVVEGLYEVYYKEYIYYGEAIKYCKDNYCFTMQPTKMTYRNQDNSNDDIYSVPSTDAGYPKDNKFKWDNIFGNSTLYYEYETTSLKENLVLYEKPRVPAEWLGTEITLDFDTELKFPIGVDMYINGSKITTDIKTTNKIEFRNETELLYYLPEPFAYDSNGTKINLEYQIIWSKKYNQNQDRQIYFYIKTPFNFIENATYPVYIDPTTQVNYTTVASGTWTVPSAVSSVEVLVVAGGGGGGGYIAGGGGAGGLIYNSAYSVTPGQEISYTVGAGGAGGSNDNGVSGDDSVFGTLTAIGGGYGTKGSKGNGGNGGSGGGGEGYQVSSGGSGTAGQGHDGGGNSVQYSGKAGGGGGAGEAGNTDGLADGGDGLYYGDIFSDDYGASGWFAGGGGGSENIANSGGDGGTGGGADGDGGGAGDGGDGQDGTGGGGGAAYGGPPDSGGDGGDGIILFKYNQTFTISINETNFNVSNVEPNGRVKFNVSITPNSDEIIENKIQLTYPNSTSVNYTASRYSYMGCFDVGSCDDCSNETCCADCSEAGCSWTPSNFTIPLRFRDSGVNSGALTFAVLPNTSYAALLNALTDDDVVYSMAWKTKTTSGFTSVLADDAGSAELANYMYGAIPYGSWEFEEGKFLECGNDGSNAYSGTITLDNNMGSTDYAFICTPADDDDSPACMRSSVSSTQVGWYVNDDAGSNEAVPSIDYCVLSYGEYTVNDVEFKAGSATTSNTWPYPMTVTFDTMFSNSNYSVFLTDTQGYSGDAVVCEVDSRIPGGFTATCEDDDDNNRNNIVFTWIAFQNGDNTLKENEVGGTLDCSVYTNETGCTSCSHCDWGIINSTIYEIEFNDTSQEGTYEITSIYAKTINIENTTTFSGLTFTSMSNVVPGIDDFAPTNDTTLEPGLTSVVLNITAQDANGDDSLEVSFINDSDGSVICTNTSISPGTSVRCMWEDVSHLRDNKWYVNVSDGKSTNTSGTYNFSITNLIPEVSNVGFYSSVTKSISEETADSYACEGNFDPNFPCSNGYDGDYSTFTNSTDSSAKIYMNYTKPNGANSARMNVTYRYSSVNHIIPTDCWDYDADKLVLRINWSQSLLLPGYDDITSECYNGTKWHSIATSISADQFSEERIIWNVTKTINNYNILNATYTDTESDIGTVYFINATDDSIFCTNTSVTTGTTVNCMVYGTSGTKIEWYVNVSDGFSTVSSEDNEVAVNKIPTISNVNITPDTAYTNSTLTCDWTFVDTDNDPEIETRVVWYVEGALTETDYYTEGESYPTLDSSNFAKDENVTCGVEGYDGYSYSSQINNSIIISNLIPTLSGFEPSNNTEDLWNDIYVLNVTYTDTDSDTGTISFVNATDDSIFCTNSSVSSGTTVGCGISSSPGTDIQWYANATDGTDITTSGTYNFSVYNFPRIFDEKFNESSIMVGESTKITANVTHYSNSIDTVWFELEYPNSTRFNYSGGNVGEESGSSWCYQESANETELGGNFTDGNCGLNYDGSYSFDAWENIPYVIDGYWNSTYAYGYSDFMYINYSKPSQSLNSALWQIAFGDPVNISNFTITSSCLDLDPVQLRIESHPPMSFYGNYTCWDGDSWNQLGYDSFGFSIYEEAMWWNVESGLSTNQYEYNLTDTTQSGTYYLRNVYANTTTGLINQTSPNSELLVNASDTCTCPGDGNNWEIDMSDYCTTYTNCDLGVGNITFINTGAWYINATVSTLWMDEPVTDQVIWLNDSAILYIG